MPKRVSVIVPVYNVKEYLCACIDSIIAQTYRELEIILVDDGSTDGSGEICDRYKEADDRIVVLHKVNGGLSSARNAGIKLSTGEYLCFIDSDDQIHPQFVEALLFACEKNSCPVAVCKICTSADWSKTADSEDTFVTVKLSEEVVDAYYGKDHIRIAVAWNKLYRRDIISEIRFPEGKIHEDEYTTVKYLYRAERIAWIDESLYCYTQRENSITSQPFSMKRLDVLGAYPERRKFFEEQGETKYVVREEYCYLSALLDFYFIIKKRLPEERKKTKELLTMYREALRMYDKNRWQMKRRLFYGVCLACPGIYSLIKRKRSGRKKTAIWRF